MSVALTVEHLTEKGNLRKVVSDGFRDQIEAKIVEVLGVAPAANGSLFRVIATAPDGTPFYATISVTIGMADPNVVKEPKAKAKAVTVEPVDLGL